MSDTKMMLIRQISKTYPDWLQYENLAAEANWKLSNEDIKMFFENKEKKKVSHIPLIEDMPDTTDAEKLIYKLDEIYISWLTECIPLIRELPNKADECLSQIIVNTRFQFDEVKRLLLLETSKKYRKPVVVVNLKSEPIRNINEVQNMQNTSEVFSGNVHLRNLKRMVEKLPEVKEKTVHFCRRFPRYCSKLRGTAKKSIKKHKCC